ncbi:MAG: ATP-binding cassette domain-containing protein, partial [Pyrobaculum sp.]
FAVEGVSVSVGENLLVRDVSFSVQKGEVFYILGPNGVGKSSLLKAIMGVPGYEIVGGRVKLEEDLTRLPPVEMWSVAACSCLNTPAYPQYLN